MDLQDDLGLLRISHGKLDIPFNVIHYGNVDVADNASAQESNLGEDVTHCALSPVPLQCMPSSCSLSNILLTKIVNAT